MLIISLDAASKSTHLFSLFVVRKKATRAFARQPVAYLLKSPFGRWETVRQKGREVFHRGGWARRRKTTLIRTAHGAAASPAIGFSCSFLFSFEDPTRPRKPDYYRFALISGFSPTRPVRVTKPCSRRRHSFRERKASFFPVSLLGR